MRMRERIVALYVEGKSTKQIAALMGTRRSGTRRIRQYLRERGTLEPTKPKAGHASGLTRPRSSDVVCGNGSRPTRGRRDRRGGTAWA